MNVRVKRLSILLALLMVMAGFQNCGDVKFESLASTADAVNDKNGESKEDADLVGDPESPPSDEPKPPFTPTPVPPIAVLPDDPPVPPPPPPDDKCMGIACDLVPLVETPGVVTILLAMGDTTGEDLVIDAATSQLLAETLVRYATPVINPKIIVVLDKNNQGESKYDPKFIAEVLLKRYSATFMHEPAGGLSLGDVKDYDLVWFNNPGFPFGKETSFNTLTAFKGGVILSGDDMSRGDGFVTSSLTGLKNLDNGVAAVCNGTSYPHDNNKDYEYSVTVDPSKIPNALTAPLEFKYGNDIDNAQASPDVEVIATAVAGGPGCTEERPVIARYKRQN